MPIYLSILLLAKTVAGVLALLSPVEDALSPGFIIDELEDGRYTVLVPSVPTPAAGALFILPRERVHPPTCRSRRP